MNYPGSLKKVYKFFMRKICFADAHVIKTTFYIEKKRRISAKMKKIVELLLYVWTEKNAHTDT